jgi:hypothetical protein
MLFLILANFSKFWKVFITQILPQLSWFKMCISKQNEMLLSSSLVRDQDTSAACCRDTIMGHNLQGMGAHYIPPNKDTLILAMEKYSAYRYFNKDLFDPLWSSEVYNFKII